MEEEIIQDPNGYANTFGQTTIMATTDATAVNANFINVAQQYKEHLSNLRDRVLAEQKKS